MNCVLGNEEDVLAREREKQKDLFKAHYAWYKISPDCVGQTYLYNGKLYVIEGLSTTSRKYPIYGTANGKAYKWTSEFAKSIIEKGILQ